MCVWVCLCVLEMLHVKKSMCDKTQSLSLCLIFMVTKQDLSHKLLNKMLFMSQIPNKAQTAYSIWLYYVNNMKVSVNYKKLQRAAQWIGLGPGTKCDYLCICYNLTCRARCFVLFCIFISKKYHNFQTISFLYFITERL